MMTRAQSLQGYLDEMRSKKFAAGRHDCALFAAGWVDRATGSDHAAGWRGRYRGLKRGQALLNEAGYSDHIDLVSQTLNEMPPALAQAGDLAVVEGAALGIMSGERVFVLRRDGLGHVSRTRAYKAFRV